MIIETLILSIIAAGLGAIIGYFYGTKKEKEQPLEYETTINGWDITVWKGIIFDNMLLINAKKRNQEIDIVFDPETLQLTLDKHCDEE